MNCTSGKGFSYSWGKYRYQKEVIPYNKDLQKKQSVNKLTSYNDETDWQENILGLISKLMDTKRISDLNQVAFLFSSVKDARVKALALFLEKNGISVYSPRSGMFFERTEIKIVIGCLLYLLPSYVSYSDYGTYSSLSSEIKQYYGNCYQSIFVMTTLNALNVQIILLKQKLEHEGSKQFDYSGILQKVYELDYFVKSMNLEVFEITHISPKENLLKFAEYIRKYEELYHISGRPCDDRNTEILFNRYLYYLIRDGVSEYEDKENNAPSGYVPFLTIHQAKGLEFPVVVVGSLGDIPRKNNNQWIDLIASEHYHREKFEPEDQIKYFDFWRKYYTAFSRAKELLLLTCNKDSKTPSKYFSEIYDSIPEFDNKCDYELEPDLEISDNSDIDLLQDALMFDIQQDLASESYREITVYKSCDLVVKFSGFILQHNKVFVKLSTNSYIKNRYKVGIDYIYIDDVFVAVTSKARSTLGGGWVDFYIEIPELDPEKANRVSFYICVTDYLEQTDTVIGKKCFIEFSA